MNLVAGMKSLKVQKHKNVNFLSVLVKNQGKISDNEGGDENKMSF